MSIAQALVSEDEIVIESGHHTTTIGGARQAQCYFALRSSGLCSEDCVSSTICTTAGDRISCLHVHGGPEAVIASFRLDMGPTDDHDALDTDDVARLINHLTQEFSGIARRQMRLRQENEREAASFAAAYRAATSLRTEPAYRSILQ